MDATVNLGISESTVVESGLRIEKVEKFGSARKAGLAEGDIITSFGGSSVGCISTAQELADRAGVGAEIEVRLLRGGQPVDLTMKLKAKREPLQLEVDEIHEVLERKISPSRIL